MLVFEHGVCTEADADRPAGLRLIASDQFPVYSGYSMSIVDLAGVSLNERLSVLLTVNRAHAIADFYEERDVLYAMRASIYHVDRLVGLYADVTRMFEIQTPVETAIRGNTSEPRIFFEVDAFLGAARRYYEQLRRLLWKHYGGDRGGRPRSFESLLSTNIEVPPAYRDMLESSWATYGSRMREYRDSLSHNDPLNDGQTTCWLQPFGGAWGLTVSLPSNPQAKSRKRFLFDGPDALTYCHEVVSHLTDLTEATHLALRTSDYLI